MRDYQYIDEAPVDIEPREVLRMQGIRSGLPQLKEHIQCLVQSQIARGYKLIQPQAVFHVFPARLGAEGRVELEGGSELSMGRLAKKWTGLENLALAICTIGPTLEGEVSEMFNAGDYAAAIMLDSAGSVAVESLADHVNNVICQRALSEGLALTPRVSPGYGDWAVQEQRTLFDLLPGDRIGVTLTGKSMMHPRKSISFAVGMGEGFTVGEGIGRCRRCDMVSCPYRAD